MAEERKLKGIAGLYSAISALINEREAESRLAIDASELAEDVRNEVDIYSASLDWYIRFALRAAIEVGLYQKGYRSVAKGEGIFVNPNNCNKPEYLARLFNNAKLTEAQKQHAVNLIRKAIKTSGCEGQLSFDFDTGLIVEDVTEAQLIEMLRDDAKRAV